MPNSRIMARAAFAVALQATEGVEVALHLHRLAHVGADDLHQALVHDARPHQRQQRQEEPFVEDLPAVRRLPPPPMSTTWVVEENSATSRPLWKAGEVTTMS